jgi:sn-glycerol 3-phosphate transport system substrate-binding protein
MKRRSLLAASAALAAVPFALTQPARGQAGRSKIVFWHAMTGPVGESLNLLVNGFNISQKTTEVTAVFKGTYPETLTAAIAAFRAGEAPHLVQVFEVGTASMLAAGKAVKQTWELIKETGVAINPDTYVPSIRGYYSLPDGRMASMPFNSSTAVMWYNKDQFEKAGLDPEKPPATWQQMLETCRTLKAKATGVSSTWSPCTTAWPTWIQLEQYSAIHNLPYATKANGFEGLDAELKFNGPAQVKQIQRLLDMAKEGLFKYGGRDNKGDDIFPSGEAAIGFNSSGARGLINRTAKFKWAASFLPYDPDVIAKPINSIIGGASLWTMTAPNRTAEDYKGAAEFLKFIGLPENDARWHQQTGYVPVTTAGYDLTRQQGYYDKNPGADLPFQQLTRGTVTANSKGIRLGRMLELRSIIDEELEKALQGQQNAKQALDSAVTRGNRVLRDFQRSVKA